MKKVCKFNLTDIAFNKRAYYEYFIKDEIEAGLVLQGWEVKSLYSKHVTINDSYVMIKNNEAFLFGAHFIPQSTIASHYLCNTTRTRKLLLNKYEIRSLYGYINRENYTAIALSLYWKNTWCKVKIGLAKGKKQYDRRFDLKKREWKRDKERIIKKVYC